MQHYSGPPAAAALEETNAGEAPGLNFRQKIAVVFLDVLLIVELFIAMYYASNNPDDFTPVFFKVFFSLIIPTLLVGRMVIKRLRTAED